MKRLKYIYPVLLLTLIPLIVGLFTPFIISFIGEQMDSNSIRQAADEVYAVVMLTAVITGILTSLGWLIYDFALNQELKHTQYSQREDLKKTWFNNYWHGISTELIGAAITAFFFGIVLVLFQQHQAVEKDKADLILQMSSPDNGFALNAVHNLRSLNWLVDGTLNGQNFSGSKLMEAKLESSSLIGANFSYSDLTDTNFQSADLTGADFTGAILEDTVFAGATLIDIKHVSAIFNENTILPDKTTWNNDVDILRYTDPSHPNYWIKEEISIIEFPCTSTILGSGSMLNQIKVLPNSNSPANLPVQRGSTVIVMQMTQDFGETWYQIDYDDNIGWILSSFVSVPSECA